MKPLALLALLAFCSACGARSELRGSRKTCAEDPWIVFDYCSSPDVQEPDRCGIYAMRADGSSLHPLDLDGARGIFPTVSPNGAKLLYTQLGDDLAPKLFVLRDLTTHVESTVAKVTFYRRGAMSPNNELLAYAPFFEAGDLHIVSADGTGDRVLASPGWFDGPHDPVFSPDSSTVYFLFGNQLSSIHTDGVSPQVLTQSTGRMYSFTLAPDGSKVVAGVKWCADDPSFQLRVLPLASLPVDFCTAGKELAELTSMPFPSWGPDDLIAYHDDSDIYLVHAGGGGSPHNITSSLDGWAGDPVWASGCIDL